MSKDSIFNLLDTFKLRLKLMQKIDSFTNKKPQRLNPVKILRIANMHIFPGLLEKAIFINFRSAIYDVVSRLEDIANLV